MFGWLLNLYGQDFDPVLEGIPWVSERNPAAVQPSIICCENQNLVIFILRAGSATQMTPVKYVKFRDPAGPSKLLPGVHESDCDLDESDHARDY